MKKTIQILCLSILTLLSSNSFADEVCGHIGEIKAKSSSNAEFFIEIDSQTYWGTYGETIIPIATAAFIKNHPVCLSLVKNSKVVLAISLKR